MNVCEQHGVTSKAWTIGLLLILWIGVWSPAAGQSPFAILGQPLDEVRRVWAKDVDFETKRGSEVILDVRLTIRTETASEQGTARLYFKGGAMTNATIFPVIEFINQKAAWSEFMRASYGQPSEVSQQGDTFIHYWPIGDAVVAMSIANDRSKVGDVLRIHWYREVDGPPWKPN